MHQGHLAARGVPDIAVDQDAAVAKEIEITVKLYHLLPGRQGRADLGAQRGQIAGDVDAGKSGLWPERVDDLVALIDEGRGRELGDVARMVEVHVPEDDIIDVGYLIPGLL